MKQRALGVPLIVFFLALLFSPPLFPEDAAGFAIGGISLFRADIGSWEEIGRGAASGGASVLQPSISFRGESCEATVTPRLGVSSDGVASIGLAEASVSFEIEGNVFVRLGRFAHEAGAARLLRNGDFLSGPVTPERLVDGPAVSARPDNALSVTYRSGIMALTATVAPFTSGTARVSGESALFPRKWIRDPYEYSVFFPVSESLSEIRRVNDDAVGRFAIDPSFLAEFNLDDSSFSFGASLFYGRDRTSADVANVVSLEISDPGHYRLELDSRRAAILGIGLSGRLVRDRSTGWFDAAFAKGRLLSLDTPYDSPGAWQKTGATDSLSFTTGCSATFGERGAEAGIEWRNAVYFSDVEDMNFPFLHRALCAFASASFADGAIGTTVECAYSLSDGSLLLSPGVRYAVSENHNAALGLAIPLGDTSSELGQFASTQSFFMTLSFSVR